MQAPLYPVVGAMYYYKLETVDIHGQGRFFGPVFGTVSQGRGGAAAQAAVLTVARAEGSIMAGGFITISPPFVLLLG